MKILSLILVVLISSSLQANEINTDKEMILSCSLAKGSFDSPKVEFIEGYEEFQINLSKLVIAKNAEDLEDAFMGNLVNTRHMGPMSIGIKEWDTLAVVGTYSAKKLSIAFVEKEKGILFAVQFNPNMIIEFNQFPTNKMDRKKTMGLSCKTILK